MRIEFWEPEEPISPGCVSDVLELVCIEIPEAETSRWSRTELVIAYDWAMREHYRASDNIVRRRPKPTFVTDAENRHKEATHG